MTDCDTTTSSSSSTISSISVPIQVILYKKGQPKRAIQIYCKKSDTIQEIKAKLANTIDGNKENDDDGKQQQQKQSQMNVIFCGKALADADSIGKLEIGPMTCLIVTVKTDQQDGGEKENADKDGGLSSSDEDDCSWVKVPSLANAVTDQAPLEEITEIVELPDLRNIDQQCEKEDEKKEKDFTGSFHVFCKGCQRMERAKLRAYCRQCQSSAIVFKNAEMEPKCWRDVMDTNQLRVDCQECNAEMGVNVNFRFKCVECNEIGIPLMHIKRNYDSSTSSEGPNSNCMICNSPTKLRINLGCAHVCCVDCFCAYAAQHLINGQQQCLIYNHSVGFTICCPVAECPAFVSDVHTFYLLGIENYKKYQETAARMYFQRHASARCYCPADGCGAAFLVEDDNEEEEENGTGTANGIVMGPNANLFQCPECSTMFCRFCRALGSQCKCFQLEPKFDENTELIGRISKPCPNCHVPTERAGGCAHMHCTQCQVGWCFICQKIWTDNCQWDHWFD